MTVEELEVLTWFLGQSGVLRGEIDDEPGFEEWYQQVRFGGLPWAWHKRIYGEREGGTADAREAQIQDMGERAYKQMLDIAQGWSKRLYYPGLSVS